MGPDRMRLDEIDTLAIDAWRDLAGRSLEPNPFLEPEVVLPAAELLGSPRDLVILVATDGNRLHGLVPVVAGRLWSRLPVPATVGWVHDYCALGTPLVDRDSADDALRALATGARTTPRRSPVLVLPKCAVDGSVVAGLCRSGVAIADRRTIRPIAPLGPEAPALAGKTRREMRRLRRRLQEDVGGECRLKNRAGDPEAIEDLLRLEASGWKGVANTAMGRRAGHAEFFRRVCAAFAADRRLALWSLESDRGPVAMLCELVAADNAFWFKIAVDDSHLSSAPGVQLLGELTDGLARRSGGGVVDSCANPAPSFLTRAWSHRRTVATMLVPLGATRMERLVAGRVLSAGARRHERREGL